EQMTTGDAHELACGADTGCATQELDVHPISFVGWAREEYNLWTTVLGVILAQHRMGAWNEGVAHKFSVMVSSSIVRSSAASARRAIRATCSAAFTWPISCS